VQKKGDEPNQGQLVPQRIRSKAREKGSLKSSEYTAGRGMLSVKWLEGERKSECERGDAVSAHRGEEKEIKHNQKHRLSSSGSIYSLGKSLGKEK